MTWTFNRFTRWAWFAGIALGLGHNARAAGIIEAYPGLEQFTYAEKNAGTYVGVGLSPVTIINNRIGFSANIFQVHWIKKMFDFELLSASYGVTIGQAAYANDQYFVLRSIPKIKLFKGVSVGPVIGLEYVSFSNLNANLNKNNFFAPSEPFSASGVIYGGAISETFPVDNGHFMVKLNQIIYRETYNYLGTSNGWNYYFQQTSLNSDPSPIQPTTVFVLEVSILY